jgi:hypothetical protein
MGTRTTRQSSDRKAAPLHARKGKRKTPRRKPARKTRSHFDPILGALSDALSIIATAANALVAAQERAGTAAALDVGDEIVTLQEGLRQFRLWYEALDIALREVRS